MIGRAPPARQRMDAEMKRLLAAMNLRDRWAAARPKLRYCVRATTVALVAFWLGHVSGLPLHGLWAVLTAVVVTQMSAGGSVRATVEYMIGTFGGAIYAAITGLLIPHTTAIAQGGVLAFTIAPLALAAALNPNFPVPPFSAG